MHRLKELFIILIVFASLHLILSAAAPQILPSSSFPYLDDLQKTGLPASLYSFGNFDGAIYLKIAREGYLPLTQAFFPLYPIIIFILGVFVPGHIAISALLVSLISTFMAFILFHHLSRSLLQEKQRGSALIFLLLFPTSFYFISIYTESLFFALLCATIWFAHKREYHFAILTGVLLGLTRVAGIFAPLIILGILFEQHKSSFPPKQIFKTIQSILRSPLHFAALIAPIIGFGIYSLYLYLTMNDFLAFFHLQPLSNAGRSTDLVLFPQVMYRYIKIFFTAQPNFQYFIAVIEFITFTGIGALLTYDLWKIVTKKTTHFWTRLGMNLFSFANLILPTLTGTFTSLPRYALLSLSVFFVLSEISNKWLKICIATVFAILHIILFMHFIQGYFVS